MPVSLGFGLSIDMSSVAGAGGGGYVAQAVHFDGATSLLCNSLTATDNAFVSFSFWMRRDKAVGAAAPILWAADADDNQAYVLGINLDGGTGGNINLVTFSLPGFSDRYHVKSAAPGDDVWVHFVGCVDTNHDSGSRHGKIYMDDVDVTVVYTDLGVAFTQAYNGYDFLLFSDGFASKFTGDIADMRVMPGTSLLDGSGDIPEATRRLFIDADGKPVNPAIATAALGEPCILFSGDASTFIVNQGTGGSFTLTGTLTDAATSPSD
jgi:hypothetical protein